MVVDAMKPKMMMIAGDTKKPMISSEIPQATANVAAESLRSKRSLKCLVA
jgi:hypothetical protein